MICKQHKILYPNDDTRPYLKSEPPLTRFMGSIRPNTKLKILRRVNNILNISEEMFLSCPTQLAVSVIMFGVTLEQRRYISESGLKLLLLILPPFLLVSTVVFQELYIPETSTQEIIIGFPFTNPVNLLTW